MLIQRPYCTAITIPLLICLGGLLPAWADNNQAPLLDRECLSALLYTAKQARRNSGRFRFFAIRIKGKPEEKIGALFRLPVEFLPIDPEINSSEMEGEPLVVYTHLRSQVPAPSDDVLLAFAYKQRVPGLKEQKNGWLIRNFYSLHLNPRSPQRYNRRLFSKQRPLMIRLPDAKPILREAIRDLVLRKNADNEDVEPLDVLPGYLASDDLPTRQFATWYAAANAMEISEPDDRANRYAKIVLGTADPDQRTMLAEAYENAVEDILPADTALLKPLLHHPDPRVSVVCLQEGVRDITGRRKQVAPLLRDILNSEDTPQTHRLALLEGLKYWRNDSLELQASLRKVLEQSAETAEQKRQQVLALQMLLDANADGAETLAMQWLDAMPSAVLMDYLVDQQVYPAVPRILQAVRDERIAWEEPTRLAMSLLTGRLDWTTFEQYDAWWRQAEEAGYDAHMLEHEMHHPEMLKEIRQRVEELGNSQYRVRRNARERLLELIPPVPEVLVNATKSTNAEVALTARQVIAEATNRVQPLREKLHALAEQQRWDEADPTNDTNEDQRVEIRIQGGNGAAVIVQGQRQVGIKIQRKADMDDTEKKPQKADPQPVKPDDSK